MSHVQDQDPLLQSLPGMSDHWILADLGPSVLRKESVQTYRSKLIGCQRDLWQDLPDLDFLQRIGAVRRSSDEENCLHPTVAGLLLFGDTARIQSKFPGYLLDYQEIGGAPDQLQERIRSDDGTWSGNLLDFFNLVFPRLLRNCNAGPPVQRSLQEALVNSFVHADYFESGGIVIRKTPKQIVIENPGYIRLGKKQMRKGGESFPRNTRLMDLGLAAQAGSGVPDLFAAWDSAGWKAPVYEERFYPSRTILTLSFAPREQTVSTTGTEEPDWLARNTADKHRIIQYLKLVGAESPQHIADYIGLPKSQTRVLLRELMQDGCVQAEGENFSRCYFLTGTQ